MAKQYTAHEAKLHISSAVLLLSVDKERLESASVDTCAMQWSEHPACACFAKTNDYKSLLRLWPQRRGTTVSGHNAGEPCTQRHSTGLTSDVVKPWLPLLLVLVSIHIAHQLGPIVQAGRKVAIPFRFWIPVVEMSWGARHQFVVLPPVASGRL